MEVLEVIRGLGNAVVGLAVRRVQVVAPVALPSGGVEPNETYTMSRGRLISDVTWDTENHKFVRNALTALVLQAEPATLEAPGTKQGADEDITECTSLADVIAAALAEGSA